MSLPDHESDRHRQRGREAPGEWSGRDEVWLKAADEPGSPGATMCSTRAVDREIVERLRRSGFAAGPEWRVLAAALLEYGYVVLVVWGCNGSLARHAVEQGGASARRLPTDLCLDEDEAHALAAEVLIVAIEKFRTRSLPEWDPCGGASLATYFIGRCLMELADVYAVWHNRERRPLPIDHTCVDDGRYGARPDDEAEARVLTDQLLANDPELRRALMLQSRGFKLDEIAAALGRTRGGVSSLMHRGRQRISGEGGK